MLIAWQTFGGGHMLGRWGTFCAVIAATWTVVYALHRDHERQDSIAAEAYRAGREEGRRAVTQLR